MNLKTKEMIKAVKQKIDWIFILTGSCMITYGIFDFSIVGGKPLRLLSPGDKTVHAYGYFYTPNSQVTIMIGVSLLVFGVLLYKEKRMTK